MMIRSQKKKTTLLGFQELGEICFSNYVKRNWLVKTPNVRSGNIESLAGTECLKMMMMTIMMIMMMTIERGLSEITSKITLNCNTQSSLVQFGIKGIFSTISVSRMYVPFGDIVLIVSITSSGEI